MRERILVPVSKGKTVCVLGAEILYNTENALTYIGYAYHEQIEQQRTAEKNSNGELFQLETKPELPVTKTNCNNCDLLDLSLWRFFEAESGFYQSPRARC